jgi:hypothetical protein
MVTLVWARSIQNIRDSLTTFNVQSPHNLGRGCSLAIQTTYWVYDSKQKLFGPNKFVAYKDMNYARYNLALTGKYTGARFNGTKAKENIQGVLNGKYVANPHLHARLISWAISLFGPGILAGVDQAKWKFIDLPLSVVTSAS